MNNAKEEVKEGQVEQNLLDSPDNLVEGKGRDRWNLTKKAKYLAALLGTSASLSLITACNSTPTSDLVNEANTTVTPVTLTVENPQITPTPLVINTPSSTPSPEKSATASPESKTSTPPPGSKIVNSENRWGPVVDKGIEVWTGDTWEKHNLPEYDMVLDTKNNLIGVIDRKTGSYLVIQDTSVFPLKVKDPAKEWPTPTPISTKAPATPTSPPTTDKTPTTKPPETGPSATSTPEIVKTWPEVIKGKKITIYNDSNKIGVVPSNLTEIEYLATKFATYPAANGFEFHFLNYDEVERVPLYAGGYDVNVNWEGNGAIGSGFAGSPLGRVARIPNPAENIYRYYITLPKILDSYPNNADPSGLKNKDLVKAYLNSVIDDMFASEICGKGNWQVRSQCDPEAQAFMQRSFKDNSKSNFKVQFPSTK